MADKNLYNFRHRAAWDVGRAYEITALNEEEWGIPKIENRRSSIPIAFDLFPTFPKANAHGIAITYPTAKRSIGTLAHQYLNRNHIMKGDYITEDFQADRDTLLGAMIAARLINEPPEPAVFIERPAICQVLGVIWVLSEHGEKVVEKLREAVAKGEKEAIGTSYEVYFNDRGFIWRNRLFQEGYVETAEEAKILQNLNECLGYSNGMVHVASSYEDEKPVLLAGGADGFILFHGAGIIEGEGQEPAYSDAKGQFNLLAKREIPAYMAHAGLTRYTELKNQEERVDKEELQALFAGFKDEIVAALKLAKPEEGKEPKPIDEKVVAGALEKIFAAKRDEIDAKFEEAVAKAVEAKKPEIEKAVRDELETEAKAYKEMVDLCAEHEVEIKDKPEPEERAVAKDKLQEFAKEPKTAIVHLKAEILGLPKDKKAERTQAATLPAGGGGDGGDISPFKTPEELEQEVDN